MATISHSLSSEQVWFKPLNDLQQNVKETLLAVCVPPTEYIVLTGGTAGLIKVWDALSGRLQAQILVGSVILKMMWIPQSRVQSALVVGAEDGSVLLYWYRPPSYNAFLPFISPSFSARFRCTMKVVFPSEIEDLTYHGDILAVVGGNQLKLFSLGSQRAGLRRTEQILQEHDYAAPHQLLTTLQSLDLKGKRLHTANFATQNSLVVSFVDSLPSGQSSILALLQINPWKIIRAIKVNKRVGSLSVNPSGEKLAFTNLTDGINIFSLPSLLQLGAITEKLDSNQNYLVEIVFLDNNHIVTGGPRNVRLYNINRLGIVSTFYAKEVASVYRCISCSSRRKLIIGGSDDGWLCAWSWNERSSRRRSWWPTLSLPSQGILCALLIFLLVPYLPVVLLGIKLHSQNRQLE